MLQVQIGNIQHSNFKCDAFSQRHVYFVKKIVRVLYESIVNGLQEGFFLIIQIRYAIAMISELFCNVYY